MLNSKIGSRAPASEQLLAYIIGGLLVCSGLGHVLVWLIDGGSLDGSVSWRKPILFGVSAGVTVVSLGWLVGKLKPRIGDYLLVTLFSFAMLVEVGLITLQQWRGVASHFNQATPFDSSVLFWIEWLVIFATIVIADLTWRSFQPLPTRSDMTLAIRSGMCLLLFSCLLGFAMVMHGNRQIALGKPPELYGAAGVMKFPHGVAIHAIQFLPFLAWTLRKLEVAEKHRYRVVVCALSSLLVFTAFSLLQTFSGRARFDFTWLSGSVLVTAIALLLAPLGIVVRSVACRVLVFWRHRAAGGA